jgi:hypothetical protein
VVGSKKFCEGARTAVSQHNTAGLPPIHSPFSSSHFLRIRTNQTPFSRPHGPMAWVIRLEFKTKEGAFRLQHANISQGADSHLRTSHILLERTHAAR